MFGPDWQVICQAICQAIWQPPGTLPRSRSIEGPAGRRD